MNRFLSRNARKASLPKIKTNQQNASVNRAVAALSIFTVCSRAINKYPTINTASKVKYIRK
tara:strand:+ start:2325 stop:2507 length:183 start_codon:yes stop_codon:yes gene_type:complete